MQEFPVYYLTIACNIVKSKLIFSEDDPLVLKCDSGLCFLLQVEFFDRYKVCMSALFSSLLFFGIVLNVNLEMIT